MDEPLFTFVQISDVHVGNEVNRPVHERLQAAVQLANKLEPAFVIDTGDIATHPVYGASEGNLAEFDEYKAYVASLKMPLYVVPGNHDIGYADPGESTWGKGNPWGRYEDLVAAYEETIGPLDQSFSRDGYRFVLVNNNPAITKGTGVLSSQQLHWLEDELKRDEVTFIFCHVQILEEGTGSPWGQAAQILVGLCRQYGVPAVAYGHKHEIHIRSMRETQYIMAPDLKVLDHRGILQYRIFSDCFTLWLYDVFTGEGEPLGVFPYPLRTTRPLSGNEELMSTRSRRGLT